MDDRGETAFTSLSDGKLAVALSACDMRLRFIVQAIVDNFTGDVAIAITADQIRAEAFRRTG